MNRKLPEWAMIAEIASSIAVVITVVFLVMGIRDNTSITRAVMFDSTMHGFAELRGHVVSDPEVADLWDAFQDLRYDELDRTSQTRIRHLVALAFENYQRAFYARNYGVLGDSEWTRFEIQMCFQYANVMTSEGHAQFLSAVLTTDFWNYLSTNCELPAEG